MLGFKGCSRLKYKCRYKVTYVHAIQDAIECLLVSVL